MSFKTSFAQQLAVFDVVPTPPAIMDLSPLEVADIGDFSALSPEMDLEVGEPHEVEIVVEELPGAPEGTKDPEPPLEVSEEPMKVEEKSDDNDAKKKPEKWDWEKRGPHGFVAWIKERLDSVPKHSGYDSAGLERAVAYLERLDNEISKAMRSDLDEELDANKIEEVRVKIDDGIARLHGRLDKVKKSKKSPRKKRSEVEAVGFTKEAQKITGVQGIYVVAPLFISRLARVIINGMVSAGHDAEDLYRQQVKRWKLTDREQAELQQLLYDMGMPMIQDRGFMPEDQPTNSETQKMDFMTNYYG